MDGLGATWPTLADHGDINDVNVSLSEDARAVVLYVAGESFVFPTDGDYYRQVGQLHRLIGAAFRTIELLRTPQARTQMLTEQRVLPGARERKGHR